MLNFNKLSKWQKLFSFLERLYLYNMLRNINIQSYTLIQWLPWKRILSSQCSPFPPRVYPIKPIKCKGKKWKKRHSKVLLLVFQCVSTVRSLYNSLCYSTVYWITSPKSAKYYFLFIRVKLSKYISKHKTTSLFTFCFKSSLPWSYESYRNDQDIFSYSPPGLQLIIN